jgi:MFS family permease
MSETLRPSTLGEILDRTAQLYRRNFWLFAGIGALPIGVIIALSALGAGSIFLVPGIRGGDPESGFLTGLALVLFLLVALPVYFAAYVFSMGGLTQAAVSTNRGERPTIRATLKSVTPRFWRYLWYGILQSIVVALIPAAVAGAVCGSLIYLASLAGGDTATGVALGFLVFFVAVAAIGVIAWRALGYSIGFAVCVAEQKTAWESLQRSWKLSQGSRGRIFVLFLLIVALAIAASMIGYIPFIIIVGMAAATGNGAQYTTAALVAEIVNFVVNFTLQALLAPISWIALVLFYYDQRIRKEGFDIEWMMEQAGLAKVAPAARAPESADISGPAVPPDTVEER